MNGELFTILHADDSLDDALLTRLALTDDGEELELHHVRDGVEALRFLRNEDPYRDAGRPDLVLLDLNMPRLSGHETLSAIKSDPALQSIPVVVLTTSNSPYDVTRCYELHVNSYVRKPIDFNRFVEVMGQVKRFWMGTAVLPPSPLTRV
jgi:CheY-like chemotaxis protein